MINNLIDSLKDKFLSEIKSRFNLSGEQSEKSFSIAKDSLQDGLKDQTMKNPQDVLNLFNKKSEVKESNPVVSNLISKYLDDLRTKTGLSPDIANAISKFAVPFILYKISDHFEGEKSTNLQSIFNFLGMGGSDLKESVKKSMGDSTGKISDSIKKLF